ncbi:MAG: asparagine synthase (glutamine-hydrolyzing), partial [Oscillospiraceae bacterium]|nr:asparagine synthase (glutamine-hydrolyzing) [Oscillospiraceae bacterium]
MCAIAGILNLAVDAQIEQAMLTTMRRRGPDGKGSYRFEDLCLLHTRLAIIDPTGGAQPMVLDRGTERYVISYNGELYNTEEIRQELLALGHSFYGHSDTEVLLHGYTQWKETVLDKLNGIFAFAVLEEHSGRVFLARDRIGVKPLFYKEHQGGLLFASEMKTILSYPTVEAELDADGVGEILLLGPGRTPGSGVFHNIRELEPGCWAVWERGKLRIHRYWKLRDREHMESFEETVEVVRELVTDAIRRQMVADVPIGTFLSGGLDSSLISAICAREMENRGEYLHTFSLDYKDNDKFFVPGKFQPNSDTEYIRIMQDALQSHHHWTVLTPEDLVQSIADATLARDLPGMADVDSSLLALCGQIRPFVKVALSGECADEIFGGYPWYRDPEIRDVDNFPWAQTTKQRIKFLHPWVIQSLEPQAFVHSRYLQTLDQSDILPENSKTERRMKQMVNLNFRWFMQTLLDRKDRMSMYHGLEVRVPFCDWRIAEYLYGVPWAFKDYRGYEKGLLRYAMAGILPDSVRYRKKSPYPKTHHPQYEEMVSKLLQGVLEQRDAPIFQIVDRGALEQLLYEDFPWPWYGQLMRRPQTIVYMLQINYWLEHYSVRI